MGGGGAANKKKEIEANRTRKIRDVYSSPLYLRLTTANTDTIVIVDTRLVSSHSKCHKESTAKQKNMGTHIITEHIDKKMQGIDKRVGGLTQQNIIVILYVIVP